MIYLFTGNNDYLITQEVLRWKNAFKDKHGEENIIQISHLDGNTISSISEHLVSRSLFAEKRLVIVSGFPFGGDKLFAGASDLEAQIISLLGDIPEEVLVVFSSLNPDKRKKGWKSLQSVSKVTEFSISGDDQVLQILIGKYRSIIEPNALRRLVALKGGNLQKSISEIEKLLISPLEELSQSDRGDYKIIGSDIDSYILPEFEESIFVFIDTLLNRNAKKIFSELNTLINSSNLYAVYQSILANLRIFLYIEYLKSLKKSQKEIGDILKLGNRAFLITKPHKSSYKKIAELYINLVNFDKYMKFGKFTSSEPRDMQRELENILIKFLA